MTKRYNPAPMLQYANYIIPDWYGNRKALSYINIRLLSLGWCVNCGNTGTVEATKDCAMPKSECCGGCTEIISCPNCK